MGASGWSGLFRALLPSLLLAVGCASEYETPDGEPWGGEIPAEDSGTDTDDDSDDSSGSDGSGAGTTGASSTTGSSDPTGDSDSDATGGSDPTGGEDPPPSDEIPDNAYCSEVANYDPQWSQLELDVLELVNQYRASGYDCGAGGSFGPAGPMTMDPALRCAARVHSKDMDTRNFFDHTNPSGESPWDRMAAAGATFGGAAENIAGGSPGAAGTMDQWMNSSGHCANIMNPDLNRIGVGYHPGGQWGTLWTQTFAD